MLHRSLLLSILLLAAVASATWGDAPHHAWSTSFGGTAADRLSTIDTDSYGNIYVFGYFQNTIDLGGGPLSSSGGFDLYLAKFAPDGTHIWSKRLGSNGMEYSTDMEVDAYGFISIVGRFGGTIDFGGGPIATAGGYDMFAARYNPNGVHVWSTSIGSTSSEVATGVGIGPGGLTYVVGQFNATIDVSGTIHNVVGQDDILLVRYSPTGIPDWSLSFGSIDYDWPQDVIVDTDGNVTLVSYGYGALDFGGGLHSSLGSLDVFMAQFDNGGNYRWSKILGGSSTDYAFSLALGSGNDVLVCGYFAGIADFGGGPVTASHYDVFVARYDRNGNHVLSFNRGNSENQFAREVTVDAADNIYIVGQYSSVGNLGGDTFASMGSYDMFIASYDPTGTHRWSRSFGSIDNDDAYGVAVDPHGNVFMGGHFASGIDLGGSLLLSEGLDDACLAKFSDGPTIHSVLDIPHDQGGLVNVAWDRNTLDNTVDVAIQEYTVWRAIDAAAASALIEKGAALVKDPAGIASASPGQDVIRMSGGYYWFEAASVNAARLEHYSAPVATLFDSTGAGAQYHYFQVIAHTTDPAVFFTSNPDSGYSVDNLAPAAPQNLVAQQQVGPDGLALTWDANTEPDVDHYAVYRGTDPGFTPDAGSLIATPTDPAALDTGWQWDGGYWYKVVAVDTHGNTSPTALLGPDLVTGVGDSPLANRLEQNVPNPFNPVTTIAFTLGTAGDVTLSIYDAAGRRVRTLASGHHEARRYDVTWDGRDDAGAKVASGVYFYRLETARFTQTKKMVLLK